MSTKKNKPELNALAQETSFFEQETSFLHAFARIFQLSQNTKKRPKRNQFLPQTMCEAVYSNQSPETNLYRKQA